MEPFLVPESLVTLKVGHEPGERVYLLESEATVLAHMADARSGQFRTVDVDGPMVRLTRVVANYQGTKFWTRHDNIVSLEIA